MVFSFARRSLEGTTTPFVLPENDNQLRADADYKETVDYPQAHPLLLPETVIS